MSTIQSPKGLRPPDPFRLSPDQIGVLAVLYGLVIVYSSLIVGPAGLNYVPLDAEAAWQSFRAIRYFNNGSDQRADWIANAVMLAPFGYLVNAAIGLRRARPFALLPGLVTFLVSLLFILAVKFAQLYFPPRTVSINYVFAQSLGALAGIGLFRLVHGKIVPTMRLLYREGEGLVPVLAAYSVLVGAYFLMPFDLALSPDDLLQRLSQLHVSLFPTPDRGIGYGAMLVAGDVLATVPVGMLLAVTGRGASFETLLLRGFGLVLPIAIVSLFVLGANPYAFSLVARTAGVGLGVGLMWALRGKDLWKRHYRYGRLVPYVFPAYLLLVAFARGLFGPGWLTIDEAVGNLDQRLLLPLWSLYIVSKADAGRSIFAGLALYAPVGVMVWFRRGFWSRGAGFSAGLAFFLALAIETGRMLKPGLSPDFTMPFVAAIGAAVAARAMLPLWKMFEFEAKRANERDPNEIAVARVKLFEPFELQASLLAELQAQPAYAAGAQAGRRFRAETIRPDNSPRPAPRYDDMLGSEPTAAMIDAGARLIYAHARAAQASWPRSVSLAREVWDAMRQIEESGEA